MLKKIFIGILGLVILVGGVVAYFFFFGQKKVPGVDTPGFSLQDYFPFNDAPTTTTTPPDKTQVNTPPSSVVTEPSKPQKLVMISRGPIAGATVLDVQREKVAGPTTLSLDGTVPNQKSKTPETERVSLVRFVDVATGHVNETYIDKVEITTITNTTIPKIYEALFGGSDTVFLRYADDRGIIQTFGGTLPKKIPPPAIVGEGGVTPTQTSLDLKGGYLSENMKGFAISPDGGKLFALTPYADGVIGTVSLLDGTKKSSVFDLAFTEWIPEWPNQKVITLTTKASVAVPGFVYSLDPDRKIVKKIFGGILGLTTRTSPDAKMVIFSTSANNSFSTNIYNITGRDVVLFPSVTTLPEKCVWQSTEIIYCAAPAFIPKGNYPDDWYQGKVSFTDQLYKINVVSYEVNTVANPANVGAAIDAVDLKINPSNTALTFINKKDGSLWVLDLTPETTPVQ